jgi:hypothetical protein
LHGAWRVRPAQRWVRIACSLLLRFRSRVGKSPELHVDVPEASPPKELCAQIGVDPSVTWAEAILFSLSKAAAQGDVAAAREVLAALGFSGTQSKNILAVQNNVDAGSATEFLRRSHGLSEDSLQAVYKFMDSLPREAPVVDASYFPDEDQQ